MTHTPGPWEYHYSSSDPHDEWMIGGPGFTPVIAVVIRDDEATVGAATVEKNARLIAAAPELLSVVARAARWWRMTNRNMPSVTAPWVSEANALLERVTGLSAWDVQDLEGRPVPVLDAPDAEGRAS